MTINQMKKLLWLIALLLAASLSAACGDDDTGSDGGADADTDTDTDTDTDADTDADAGLIHLANDDGDCSPSLGKVRLAGDGDENYLLAARLTSPQYPVRVTSVRYQRWADLESADSSCSTDHEQNVLLFSGSDNAPAEEPTVLASWTEPPGEIGATGYFWVEHDVPAETPVVLYEGENLFIAVGCGDCEPDSGVYLCYSVCAEAFVEAANYASSSSTPPYGWEAFDGSFDANLQFEAYGTSVDSSTP